MKRLIFITALFLLISCATIPKQTINSNPTEPSEQTALQKAGDALKKAGEWLVKDGFPLFIDTAIWNIK